MAGRLTRFLNLERARKPGATPPHGVANRERFTGEPPPVAEPEDLFRSERAAQLESGIEIDAHPDSEQPFTRCPVCEADNSKFAVKCINCRTALDTEQVREWNGRLWAERQKQRALESKPAPLPPLGPDPQRQLGAMIAQQVAEHERTKWNWGTDYQTGDIRPFGMKLLDLIPNLNVRFAVAMAMVATFFGSGIVVYVAKGHPQLQLAGTVVAVALVMLFLPGRRRRRSRWWWDDDDSY
jgi:hypothetical protein